MRILVVAVCGTGEDAVYHMSGELMMIRRLCHDHNSGSHGWQLEMQDHPARHRDTWQSLLRRQDMCTVLRYCSTKTLGLCRLDCIALVLPGNLDMRALCLFHDSILGLSCDSSGLWSIADLLNVKDCP